MPLLCGQFMFGAVYLFILVRSFRKYIDVFFLFLKICHTEINIGQNIYIFFII